MQALQSLAALAMLAWIAYSIFRTSRASARVSPAARRRTIAGASGSVALGAVLAFVVPPRVPATDGSPASLVAVTLLWLIGGCLILTGLIALAGAVSARPASGEPLADLS